MNKFIKPITELAPEELVILEKSELYTEHRKNWNYSEGSEAYYAEYFSEHNNYSFVCFENKETIALALIYGDTEIGYFGQPVDLVINANGVNKKTITEILDYFRSIAQGRILSLYSNDQLLYAAIKDSRCRITYKNQLSYSIDLTPSVDIIKQRVRNRYKSMINWCYRNLEYITIDKNNFDGKEFDKFQAFHLEIAGRKTRSDRSWQIQKEMVRAGEAFMLNGYLDSKLVSSNWFTIGKASYYGVGVYDRKLMAENNRGLAHGSMFKAIEYLSELGSSELVLSRWYTDQDLNEKVEQIMDFKRGFTDRIGSRLVTQIEFL